VGAEARALFGDRCGRAQLEPLLTTGRWLYAGAGVYAGDDGAEFEEGAAPEDVPPLGDAVPEDGATVPALLLPTVLELPEEVVCPGSAWLR